jgi:hypothetical protein
MATPLEMNFWTRVVPEVRSMGWLPALADDRVVDRLPLYSNGL